MACSKILFKLEISGEELRCLIEGYGLKVIPKTEIISINGEFYWLHEKIDEAA